MSFAKKGSRLIQVNEINFRWKITRHTRAGVKYIDVLVCWDEGEGATLMKPYGTFLSDYFAPEITPANVRMAILEALERGWDYQKMGPQFKLAKTSLQEVYKEKGEEFPWFHTFPLNPRKSPVTALIHFERNYFGERFFFAADGRKRRIYFSGSFNESAQEYPLARERYGDLQRETSEWFRDYKQNAKSWSETEMLRHFLELTYPAVFWEREFQTQEPEYEKLEFEPVDWDFVEAEYALGMHNRETESQIQLRKEILEIMAENWTEIYRVMDTGMRYNMIVFTNLKRKTWAFWEYLEIPPRK